MNLKIANFFGYLSIVLFTMTIILTYYLIWNYSLLIFKIHITIFFSGLICALLTSLFYYPEDEQ